MKIFKHFSIFFVASISFIQMVQADPASVNPRPRTQGMGNAGVAVIGDEEAASINPAGLADVDKFRIHPLPLLIEVPFNVGLIGSYQDFNDKTGSSSTATKQTALSTFLNDMKSSANKVRINIYPSFTKKHFHFGFLADFLVDAQMRVGGLTSNQMTNLGNSNGTAGLILGAGYSFFGDSIAVGMTLKPLYRVAVTANDEQTINDVLQGKNPNGSIPDQIFGTSKGSRKAFGLGVDVGVKYKVPLLQTLLSPSVGLTYQDIGDTRFIGDNTPKNIPQSLSVGAAINPNWKFMRNTVAVDFRNITESQEFMNKLHVGAESVLFNLVAVRAGFSQGYVTAGLALLTRLLELDVYLTAQEAGEKGHFQAMRTLGFKLDVGF